MKVTFPIIASFLVSAASAGNNMMLRRKGGVDESHVPMPSPNHRKLSHENDINSGTSVVNLCDYHPGYGVFNPLPVTVTNAEPDKVFKIENAARTVFVFSTCGTTLADTAISIWDGFDKGTEKYLAFNGDQCGWQSTLTWVVPDNSVYYVKFGGYRLASYNTNATWYTILDWSTCLPPAEPTLCGPSIFYPSTGTDGATHHLLCCNNITGAVGPNCCGDVPYDASSSICCGDESILPGINEALCSPSSQPTAVPSPKPSSDPSASPTSKPTTAPSAKPSSQPTSTPTSKPSSFPSSQPSQLTCEMVNPCDYDMEDDGMGGVSIVEAYYPVCIQQDAKKNSIYRQECYPESIITGLGAGDVDPAHADRKIVNCGCCPDTLPADIDKVKGSTDVCDGGLDCLAEGASVSFSKKKATFQMCIGGVDDDNWENNFYVPKEGEMASCGQCENDGDIIV